MRRILWWFAKEAREQRAFLVILACAILFGSWVVVHLGRGVPEEAAAAHLPEAPAMPHRMERNGGWLVMLLSSLALVLLVVPGGLFASDARRGCNALTARTPGAWGAAFVGKLAFLWAVLLGTLLVHGVVLGRLAALYHLTKGRASVDVLWLGPSIPDAWNLIWGAFALAPLLVLSSVALPWLGVPTVAGAAIAASLALPTLLWLDGTPFFVEAWLGGPGPLLLIAALAGLGISAWAWFRPVRLGGSARRVAVGSLIALGVVALGTHAVGWAARERYLDFTPGEPDVELDVVGIGPNGRFAFVNAYRGDPRPDPLRGYFAFMDRYELNPMPWGPGYRQRGTRSKPFVLDLSSGVARGTGGDLLYDFPPQRELGGQLPRFVVPEMRGLGARPHDRIQYWYDADTAEVLSRDAASATSAPAPALARLDAALRAHTRQRTPQGRPVWIGEAGLTRVRWQEGEGEAIEAVPLELALPWSGVNLVRDIPGGWELTWGGHSGWPPPFASVDAETGVVRQVTPDLAALRGLLPCGWLSPRELLICPPTAGGYPHAPSSWRILDLDTKQVRSLPEPVGGSAVQPLAVVDAQRVLVLSHTQLRTLAIYELATAAIHPVPWDGIDPGHIQAAWPSSRNALASVLGSQVVVDLFVAAVVAAGGAPATFVGPPGIRVEHEFWNSMGTRTHRESRHAVAVYDGTSGRARLAQQELPSSSTTVLGLARDGTLWLLEDARRIVRYGPAPLQREVLFPRDR